MRVEPAQGRSRTSIGGGLGDHAARDRRGDGAVAGDVGRRIVTAEQRLVGQREVDATGVGTVALRPVTLSTRVSAITCPRVRPSPQVSASRRSVAYTETP